MRSPDIRPGVRRLFRLALQRPERAGAEMDDEIRLHLALRTEQLIRQGLSPAAARAEAERRFGSLDEARHRLHDSASRREHRMRTLERLDGLRHDLRIALRRIRRAPGFTAFAVLITGLGVAATTAVFSVMSPLMLRPLPFPEPERLVWIASSSGGGLSAVTSRTSNLRDYRERARSFQALTGYYAFFEYESYNLVGAGAPERLVGVGVAQDFLDVLGVRPLLGRNFVREEGVWGGRPAVILTHGFWVRRFGGDPAIVGRSITLNNVPTEVVGVLPPSFDFASTFVPASRVDFLRPFPISDETDRWGNTLAIVGRLKPGATVESAQAELDAINAQLQAADPARWGLSAVVTGLQDHIAGRFRPAMLVLAAAAVLVLAVACANLSNLLLARGQQRAQEMAVRSALGASRRRLLGQLLVESLLLAAGGGVVGVLLAVGITRWVASTNAVSIPLLRSVSVDGGALAFTLAVTLLTGLVVGLVPALQVSRGDEAATLRDVGRSTSEGRRRTSVREVLVVWEVALACVLLVGGGLLLRSFVRVLDVDLGFQPAGAVAWQLNPGRDFADDTAQIAFYDALTARVAALPGVDAVGLTDTPPLGRNRAWSIQAKGAVYERNETPVAFPRLVDSRYLQTMRIPLLEGRYFTPDDDAGSRRVMILNQTAAERLFPGEEPIDRTVLIGDGEWQVVGVVGDVRHQSLEEGAGLEMYLPYSQQPDFNALVMVVRSRLPVETLAASVGAALRAADPSMPAADYQTLDAVVDRAISPRRFILIILGAFAGTALLLAALGIYAVLSYSVSQRRREIGIRMALGESAASVQRRVVRRTVLLAVVGVALGAVLSFAASRLLQSLLYGVGSTDAPTFVGTAAVLLLVSTLAGYLPARRASRVAPVHALRAE
ncbi:MAG TPA: ABC transporter permease [Gemmatimonadaceae bacterium]|nr:ABC transporter permease [Gemmatimonadaceae bacterium]